MFEIWVGGSETGGGRVGGPGRIRAFRGGARAFGGRVCTPHHDHQ